MERIAAMVRALRLHAAGLALLALAGICARALAEIGRSHAGHEPALAYLVALAAFLLASAGVALAFLGPRLFDRVLVADRWLPHVPATFRDGGEPD